MSTAQIAHLTESDWQPFARIRLRALAESLGVEDPQYRHESAFTETQWRRRLRTHAHFVALLDECPIGLIGAQRQGPGTVYLYSLWLDPQARGHGLARVLVGSALDWARSQHVRTVTLRVACDNPAARSIYESLGFAVTTAENPPPPGEVAMSLRL